MARAWFFSVFGTRPMKRTFDIAKASGYRGFSVEFEGEGDPYVETAKLIEPGLKCLA